ncbi:complement resistance protein TraT [Thalassotalea sp. HSM 43]|uniref:complement resistance protein TraT n=1 Tax=Thalassotalea sp. HSM 43 TaxID=2552945 RepID=UPI001081633C|nr:complement resistance protein TraT [Thalassotalea sp. HSM 43]QBY04761.1 complement resistance protein TraT [Thalassotalea sp. HSM 43]
MKLIIFFILSWGMVGCGALHTAVDKKDLQVETQMSATIMLEPVPAEKRTVYLQLRNTSDKQQIDYATPVANAIAAKGYTIVDDPDQAHYWIQANVLQVGRSDLRSVNGRDKGYGAAIQGAQIGSMFGDGDGQVAATVVGGLIGVLTDALVSDIVYVMITDLQISEKAKDGVRVTETNEATLKQGESGNVQQDSVEIVGRKKYQTRITSTANQVNLTFEEAEQQLLQGLIQSMSGIL